MAEIILALTFAVALVELFLANYLFYEDPKNLLHRLAAGRCLAVSLFAFGTFFFNTAQTENVAHLWEKVRFFPFVFLVGLLFHFSMVWTGWTRSKSGRVSVLIVYGVNILFVIAGIFVEFLGSPMTNMLDYWSSNIRNIPSMIFNIWVITVYLYAVIRIIVYYYRLPKGEMQSKDKFILLGFVIFFVLALMIGTVPRYFFPEIPTTFPIWCLLADVLVVIGISKGKAFFITPASIIPQIISALHESLILTDSKGRIQYTNPTLSRWTDWPAEYYIGKHLNDLFVGSGLDPEKLENLCKGQGENLERKLRTKSKKPIVVLATASNVEDKQGTRYGIVFTLTDMTLRKTIEKARKDSEKRFRELFEDSPISVWEEDFSLLKKKLAAIRATGVADLRLYMVEHPQFIIECASLIHVLDVNKASVKLFEAKSKQQLLGVSSRLIPDVAKTMFVEELVAMWEGRTEFEMEGINHTLAGRRMYVNVRWTIPPDYLKTWSRVLVLVTDITPRKTAEMERAKLFDELQQMAIVDSLTGVYNRRYFLAMAQNEVELAKKYGNAVACIMIDLDLFKKVNDEFGHSFGDKVLGAVALEIKKSLRKVDILCRYGGDEFMILLPDVEAANAIKTAERIRERIAAKAFDVDEKVIELSASMGLAQLSQNANDLDAILTQADVALYDAKSKGRNRVVLWSKALQRTRFTGRDRKKKG